MEEIPGEEKILSPEDVEQAINFAGTFPEKNKLKNNSEYFEREKYWLSLIKLLKEDVSKGRLNWDQHDEIVAGLLASRDWLSGRDALTGLPNRASYNEAIIREVTSAERNKQPLSLLVIDVDGLKQWNDEDKSHHLGDLAIILTAQKIKEGIRISDLAARWGGDEFTVILPKVGLSAAEEISQRILEAVSKANPLSPSGKKLSVSIGIREYRGEGPTKFFEKADDAAFQAKKSENKMVVAV